MTKTLPVWLKQNHVNMFFEFLHFPAAGSDVSIPAFSTISFAKRLGISFHYSILAGSFRDCRWLGGAGHSGCEVGYCNPVERLGQ